MPNLFKIGRYYVFFWSNENNEPIHVLVCAGLPNANSTKIWLTAAGGCFLANNASRIPAHELNDILDIIAANYFLICSKWKEHFCCDHISFYC